MKRWLKTIIIILAVLVIGFLGISVFLGYSMTRVERVAVAGSPADLGLTYMDIVFQSKDGLTLRGWLIYATGNWPLMMSSPPPVTDESKIIIMLHGSEGNRADASIRTLDIAAELVKHDYNVLLFDLRGHGESEGDRLSAGYHERKDLLGALDLVKQLGYKQIGVLGFSMGAATAILTAAGNDDIDCIVADSCFADITEIMQREFAARTKFPGVFLRPVLQVVKIIYGVDFPAVKPVEAVSQVAPAPIFFIHGAEDTFLPPEHADRLLEASDNPNNRLWIAPGAEHVRAYAANPTEYISRITAFFDESLNRP